MQWNSWKFLFQRLWYYLIFQFFISEMIRVVHNSDSYLKYWYLISSVIFITSYMGVNHMIIITAHPFLFLLIIFLGGGKRSIWSISSILIGTFNLYTFTYKRNIWDFLKDTYEEEAHLILVCAAWTEVRCISFCIDYIDSKDKLKASEDVAANATSTWETIINMLSYIFYLPLLYTGSIILYDDFERSFKVQRYDMTTRLRRFIWDMILFLLYSFILDLAHHYIYFRGMQYEIEEIMDLPLLALCGGCVWMGHEFHTKHVISFGTTSAYARLDHMEAPPTPRCFARIHLYSLMWKYFDVGLYKFLVKYIYKPSLIVVSRDLRQLPAMLQKLMASYISFAFIYIWHGTTWDTLVWTAKHVLCFTLEHLGKATSTTHAYKWFKKEVLRSDEMEVRFLALVCTPLLILSTTTTSFLVGVANNYYSACLLHTSIWNTVLVTLFMYSFCQVSIALQHVSARTDIKEPVVHSKTQ
ncbi:protein-cysteine N-palmitoyltransferase Rasp-like isoform X2 [Choristoneura fumiferana]